jgi:hypothetical protein
VKFVFSILVIIVFGHTTFFAQEDSLARKDSIKQQDTIVKKHSFRFEKQIIPSYINDLDFFKYSYVYDIVCLRTSYLFTNYYSPKLNWYFQAEAGALYRKIDIEERIDYKDSEYRNLKGTISYSKWFIGFEGVHQFGRRKNFVFGVGGSMGGLIKTDGIVSGVNVKYEYNTFSGQKIIKEQKQVTKKAREYVNFFTAMGCFDFGYRFISGKCSNFTVGIRPYFDSDALEKVALSLYFCASLYRKSS